MKLLAQTIEVKTFLAEVDDTLAKLSRLGLGDKELKKRAA